MVHQNYQDTGSAKTKLTPKFFQNDNKLMGTGGQLSFTHASTLLANGGIPTVGQVAKNPEEAQNIAAGYVGNGGNFAMKVLSEKIVHKVEYGAVKLGIPLEKVPGVFSELQGIFNRHAVEGILIQPMVSGLEFAIGAKRDPHYGTVIMFTVMGGTEIELHKGAASFGLCEITHQDALDMIGRAGHQEKMNGFRGYPELDKDRMASIIEGISNLMKNRPEIAEIDLNPITLTREGELHIIDPRIITGEVHPQPEAGATPSWKIKNLEKAFAPKSVVVIGAMQEGGAAHAAVMQILGSITGKVFVKDTAEAQPACRHRFVEGKNLVAWKNEGIPNADLAVIVTRSSQVPQTLKECGEAGIKAAIIISDGFGEKGNNHLDAEIGEIADKFRIATIGPNCVGVIGKGINTMFIVKERTVLPIIGGSAGFISQSGGKGIYFTEKISGNGGKIGKVVSIGNAVCTNSADYLSFMANDKSIKAIGLYVESVPEIERFYNALKSACGKKPVFVLKGGQTEEGADATAGHTGKIMSNYEVFRHLCLQAGAIMVDGISEMADAMLMLTTMPRPKNSSIFILTGGGGTGITTTDAFVKAGLAMAKLENRTVDTLTNVRGLKKLHVDNPFDVGGSVRDRTVLDAIDTLMNADEVGALVYIPFLQVPGIGNGFLQDMASSVQESAKPFIFTLESHGPYRDNVRDILLSSGIITFDASRVAAPLKLAIATWEKYPGIDFRSNDGA